MRSPLRLVAIIAWRYRNLTELALVQAQRLERRQRVLLLFLLERLQERVLLQESEQLQERVLSAQREQWPLERLLLSCRKR